MLPSLPPAIVAPAPFPLVTWTSLSSEFVAPGVVRGEYRLWTSIGPLHISVVGVDPHETTVRIGAALAGDHIVSHGETISAMAARTGAVAGINADYFDIGATNQPLNIVVQNGRLERTPSARATVTIADRSLRFGGYRFSGAVEAPSGRLPIDGVNTWSPHGGVSVFTPQYGGALPASATAALLAPASSPAPDGLSGSYTATSVAPASGAPAATELAFNGPSAVQAGDHVTITMQTDPPLDPGATVLGGGPLLVAGGQPANDADAPAPEETNRRFPVAGIATRADGTLLLIAVDGRLPESSVGLTRPELGALMLGLGATDGMATDSGGSATLVARVLGEAAPRVLNAPSDGKERPVADGLFIYSDAPQGPPSRLVLRPSAVRALPGVSVTLRMAMTDEAGHPLGALGEQIVTTPEVAGTSAMTIERQGLVAELPVETLARVDHLSVTPSRPNPDPGAAVAFTVTGADAHGQPVALGSHVAWSATSGTIENGMLRAGAHDALVTVRAGGASAQIQVRVGRHLVPAALFAATGSTPWRFVTVPANGPGALLPEAACGCWHLRYDFTTAERAAYASGDVALPGAAVGLGFELEGDGEGEAVRATLVDRDGRLERVTLANAVDWTGWRRVLARIPAELVPPVHLRSVYAIGSLGGAPLHVRGLLGLRGAVVQIAGTP